MQGQGELNEWYMTSVYSRDRGVPEEALMFPTRLVEGRIGISSCQATDMLHDTPSFGFQIQGAPTARFP